MPLQPPLPINPRTPLASRSPSTRAPMQVSQSREFDRGAFGKIYTAKYDGGVCSPCPGTHRCADCRPLTLKPMLLIVHRLLFTPDYVLMLMRGTARTTELILDLLPRFHMPNSLPHTSMQARARAQAHAPSQLRRPACRGRGREANGQRRRQGAFRGRKRQIGRQPDRQTDR
jgi:hypothetical protein